MQMNAADARVRITAQTLAGESSWFRGRGEHFVKWDGKPGQVIAEASHNGFVPLFWHADDKRVILSTRIQDIIDEVNPDLDLRALELFSRLGFFIGNATAFQNVSILGPSQTLKWANGKVTLSGEPKAPDPFEGTRQDALHLYVAVFRRAVEKACSSLGDDTAISLTGGRDSRHIAIELNRIGFRPKFAITTHLWDIRPDLDWPVARTLCERFGWDHRVSSVPKDWRANDEWIVSASQYCAHEHGWTRGLINDLNEAGVTGCFDGVGGDVLSAGLYATANTPEKILHKWADNGLGVLSRDRYSSWMGKKDEVSQQIRDVLTSSRDFHFWHRTRRSTSLLPFRLSNQIGITPYIDKEVSDFLLSLPLSFTVDGQFHNEAIDIAAPGLAAEIPYSDETGGRSKIHPIPPRLYAAKLLLRNGVFPQQYVKGLLRGWPSIAGYSPRALTYMDMVGAQPS